MSKREDALVALASVLTAAIVAPSVPSPPTIERDEIVPQTLTASGRVVIYDAGAEASPIMSPLRYAVELIASVEIVAQTKARMELLVAAVSAALAASRTLGGVVEWVDVGAAEIDVDAVAASAPVHSATVPVTLYFTADATPQG